MNLIFRYATTFVFFIIFSETVIAKQEKPAPDTVEVGIYMTSIHNIDFREKSML